MGILQSVKNATRVVELIADGGAPISASDLIATCGGKFQMSRATARNLADTLAHKAWLQKVSSPGERAYYSLGIRAAQTWRRYITAGLEAARRKHEEVEGQMRVLKEIEGVEPGE